MNFIKKFLLLLISFLLVVLDVSFWSNFEFYGATIIVSFAVLIILSIRAKIDNLVFFSAACFLFFSALSSLPIPLLAINFFVIPFALNFIHKKYFPLHSLIISFFYFLIADFLFEFSILVYSGVWNESGILALLYFTFVNASIGIAIFSLWEKASRKLLREEIRI